MKIDKLLKFTQLTNKFQQITRELHIKGCDRKENDAEHSFQLALIAFYLLDSEEMSLKQELVIKYALIHDLVEVSAGDTDIFTTDIARKHNKKEREEKATGVLKTHFSEFKELHNLINDYGKKKDKESRFVYALDKILPVLNIYLDKSMFNISCRAGILKFLVKIAHFYEAYRGMLSKNKRFATKISGFQPTSCFLSHCGEILNRLYWPHMENEGNNS